MKQREDILGSVFDIQRFSIHDGPGIRTTVFLKGCPLHCAWCHNPEGLSLKPQLSYDKEKCIFCGKCEKKCPNGVHRLREGIHRIDFSLCKNCFSCVTECPTEALTSIGKKISAKELVKEVLRDKAFFQTSGGGVTLSGGEPLMQGEFTSAVASLLKENGIHICLETSGFASSEILLEVLPFVDVFLFDYKHSDEKEHKKLTGVSQKKILENLRLLSEKKKDILLRCPIIPDVNDKDEHYRAIASLAEELEGVKGIVLEPYHPYGLKKYEATGCSPSYDRKDPLEEEKIQKAKKLIRAHTKKVVE